uniref:Cytochrome c oxidase subunit 2 n=1 Tax=Paramoeba aparasomata TaxID=2583407 RepID=A0A5P8HBI1_9EUKA|nr:cytochrome oxidase subunit 2 [Paramoeba aparasomata]
MVNFELNFHDLKNPLTNLIIGNGDFHTFKSTDWSMYFIKPASPIMYGIIDLHDFIMVYLVFIVFFVTFMLLIILKESTISESCEFNKFNRVKSLYNVKFNHHTQLETIWIIVPSLILLTIAVPSFVILYAMDIIPSHAFSIKVVGHQWYWSYEYIMNNLYSLSPGSRSINFNMESSSPHFRFKQNHEHELLYRYSFDSYMVPSEELEPGQTRLLDTTNPLVIPIARYASVTVTSVDVIHSFAVPSLGIKIDAVPGRLNTVSMYIMELGHFYGQCSELCGVNHGFMPIEIYCVDMAGFSIYKAALAAEIVSKEDIVSTCVDSLNRLKLLKWYKINLWHFHNMHLSSKKTFVHKLIKFTKNYPVVDFKPHKIVLDSPRNGVPLNYIYYNQLSNIVFLGKLTALSHMSDINCCSSSCNCKFAYWAKTTLKYR